MHWKLVTIGISLGLLALFMVQNRQIIDVSFLAWSFSTPRSLLLISVLGVGFGVGWTAATIGQLKRRGGEAQARRRA